MQLSGKHVLITGASGGIGKALAEALLQEGAHITSIERTKQDLNNEHWISIAADVTKSDLMEKAFSQVEDPIDIIVCNAGAMKRGSVFDSSEDDFDFLMDVNVKGVWLSVKHALPKLAENGMIVLMSSRHAFGLPSDPALYGLAKRYVMDLAEVIGKTYPQYTVKVLCPGPVDTPLARVDVSEEDFAKKQKIMISPEELSQQIIKLLETESKSKLMFHQHTSTHYME